MVVEDLIAALRNALERGERLEDAKLSLLNAGYKQEEIEQAARSVESLRAKRGAIPRPKFKPLPSVPTPT